MELKEALLNELKQEAAVTRRYLESVPFDKLAYMRYGETIYFTLPKKQVLRSFCMNHLVHHRAQLGVSVPATYGPSVDDYNVIIVNPY